MIETIDREINIEADIYQIMLDALEKVHHETVDWLFEQGYKHVLKGKQFVHCITAAQIEGRGSIQTEPNTRERRDLLEQIVHGSNCLQQC